MKYVMFCAIWYHLYNLKNVKNKHGGMLLLVKLHAQAFNFTKSTTPLWVFFTFFKIVQMVPNCVKYPIFKNLSPNFSQQTFAFLKSTIATLEKGATYIQRYKKSQQNKVIEVWIIELWDVVLVSLLLPLVIIITHLFLVFLLLTLNK